MNKSDKIFIGVIAIVFTALTFIIYSFSMYGCATRNVRTSTEVLVNTNKVVVDAATTAKWMCDTGQLSVADCNNIKEAYEELKVADDAVSNALILMIENSTSEESVREYEFASLNLSEATQSFLQLLVQFNILETVDDSQ
jgi:hypothetical protein